MFIGKKYVVTVHNGELTPLVKLFEDCQDNEECVRGNMSQRFCLSLLYRIIDIMVDYCFPIHG